MREIEEGDSLERITSEDFYKMHNHEVLKENGFFKNRYCSCGCFVAPTSYSIYEYKGKYYGFSDICVEHCYVYISEDVEDVENILERNMGAAIDEYEDMLKRLEMKLELPASR